MNAATETGTAVYSGGNQRDAADPSASIWVAASAGTGKTKVLIDRVLRLMLAGTAPNRILCLTYTRAAAAEMSLRVREALGEWAVTDDAGLGAAIEILTGAAPEAEQIARARALFGQVLDCPGGLKIQTIHAFCESLLRRFPLEAGLHPHFRVLDEAAARELLGEARDDVLARATGPDTVDGEDPLAAAIGAVMGRLNTDSFASLMSKIMAARGRFQRLFEATGGIDGARAAVHEAFGIDEGKSEQSVLDEACAPSAFDGGALRAAAAAMAEGTAAEKTRAAVLIRWLEAAPDARAEALASYSQLFVTSDATVRKILLTKNALKAVADPESVLGAMETEAQRVLAVREGIRAVRSAAGSTAVLLLGSALIDAYESRKRAHARLDYDDLILKTRDLLSGRAATQWVLYKLDGGIDHVLVDEAQDTSPEQWSVITNLTQEYFAGAGTRDNPRTRFAVGDTKQSIFRFQGADPYVFQKLRADTENQAAEAMVPFRDIELHRSFRSTAPVLNAVDAVFAGADARDGLTPEGADIRHDTNRTGQAGLVELWPVVDPLPAVETYPWRTPEDSSATGEAADERLARLIAAKLKEWIGSRELPSRGRKIRAGDVLVLVRTRTRLVNALVRALKRLEIGVAGVDRMKLAEELAVMDLMALGRFLLQPDDDLSLAATLKGPWCGFDDDDLLDLAPGRSGTLWAALSARAGENPRWAEARDWLARRLAETDFERPFELFSSVLDEDDGRARLIARLGSEAEDPVNEFLELAFSHERVEAPSLQGFLDWLEGGQTEIKRDLEQAMRDEVRIMTVHGAKGLQAPVVILPDTMGVPRHPEGPFWYSIGDGVEIPLWVPVVVDAAARLRGLRAEEADEALREYHRLLYVAMTRAEDALFVAGWRGKTAPRAGNWYDLVRTGLEGLAKSEEFDFSGVLPDLTGEVLRLDGAQEAAPDRAEDTAKRPVPEINLEGWETAPPAPEPAPPRPLTPSDTGEEPPTMGPVGAGGPDRFLKGRLVHSLLQYLPGLAPEARRTAADRYLAVPAHGLDDAAQAEIAAETLAVIEDELFSALFAPGSLAEVPVTGAVRGVVIAGQVDRLAVTADGVLIVDYKTNRPVPAGPEDVPLAYLRQMARYRAVLDGIFPGRRIDCALVFTAGPKLVSLPADFLANAAAEGLLDGSPAHP